MLHFLCNLVPCCSLWTPYLPLFSLSSLYCTTVHVNPTVITISMYIFSLCTFHCNISLSVYIQKVLSVCCVLECLNGCLQDVHLLTQLNVWMTFSANVYMFLLLNIPSTKIMRKDTHTFHWYSTVPSTGEHETCYEIYVPECSLVCAVGWSTALQAGRWWVGFPMVSLVFFTDIILLAALWSYRLTKPLRAILLGCYRRQVRRADNLTTFVYRLPWNVGASTSWNP